MGGVKAAHRKENMLNHEPNLNPPHDEKLERLANYVDNLTLENLALEIQSFGLSEKIKETILEVDIPNSNEFMKEVVRNSNLEFLLQLVSKTTILEIRETLIDYLYWRNDETFRL